MYKFVKIRGRILKHFKSQVKYANELMRQLSKVKADFLTVIYFSKKENKTYFIVIIL